MSSVPGYNITVHNAFTTPILLAGAPRTFTLVNGTICAAITLGLHVWYALPLCALAQGVAAFLTKKDPYFFTVMVRHIKQKTYYEV